MERIAIVYYSLEGNTKVIATAIAKYYAEQVDVFVIKAKKVYHTTGFKKYFWGGKSVVFKELPAIEALDFDPKQYQQIFLGTPIWVGTAAPPMQTFLSQVDLSNCEVALFCTHGGGKYEKFLGEFEKRQPQAQQIGVFASQEPLILKQEAQAQQLCHEWLEQLK